MAAGDPKERSIKSLATDFGTVKRDVRDLRDSHQKLQKQVAEGFKEVTAGIKELQNSHVSLVTSLNVAITQLAVAQSLERRVERIESVLFPAKH